MRIFIFVLIVVSAAVGCSTHQPNLTGPILNIWDGSYTKQASYQLLPEGEELLEKLLAQKPDHNINDPVEIDLSGVIVVDGLKYAVERDRILLPGDRFTKIWKQKGIRQELIGKSQLLKK